MLPFSKKRIVYENEGHVLYSGHEFHCFIRIELDFDRIERHSICGILRQKVDCSLIFYIFATQHSQSNKNISKNKIKNI